ncbi:MAG: inosine/xanthosine triphosphatase [Caldilineaceae bacterium]|nr:inosine/xanthosine triphosphatase [Caldilineaceae bacterium]
MKIAIGSTNPTKVEAACRAAAKVWPQGEVVAVAVPSGVAEQPMSDDETIRGAVNRARKALAAVDGVQIGMGVEGGVQDTPHGMFVGGWAAVVDRDGCLGIGAGGRVLLPESIARRIRAGEELGPVMDDFSGRRNVKHGEGAIGIFTNGLIERTAALEIALTYALARFITPENYREE